MNKKTLTYFGILVLVAVIIGGWFFIIQTDESWKNDQDKETSDWQTHQDEERRFSFMFPGDWEDVTKEFVFEKKENLSILMLMSPEVRGMRQKELTDIPSDLVVTVWDQPGYNNISLIGAEWVGQKKYNSLEEILSDPNSPKKKINEIKIGGEIGYEIQIGGEGINYGIIVEKGNFIYQFTFLKHASRSDLTSIEDRIIESIRI